MYCDQNTKKSVVGGCTYDIETGQSTGGSCTTEHNYYGRQLFLNNITAASIWVWDGMRALDYLTSRAEVDVDKLGMCGCSGGGTQTAYLSAVDSRILASSVACYMSTFEADFTYQGSADAEQQWMNGLPLGLDKADLLEVRAPKPTQALLTTDDTVFPVQGGRDCVQEVSSAFAAFNASQNFESHEATWHHGYVQPNREALYGFFLKHFNVSGNASEEDIPSIPVRNLTVTPSGQVVWSLNSRTVHDLIVNFTQDNVALLDKCRSQGQGWLSSLGERAQKVSGFINYSDDSNEIFPQMKPLSLGQVIGQASWEVGAWVEKWALPGEGYCTISIVIHSPVVPAQEQLPAFLYISRDSTASTPCKLCMRSKCYLQIFFALKALDCEV
jgi:dienelactone hydrolase